MTFSRERQGDLFILTSAIFWGLFPVMTALSYHSISALLSLTISSFFTVIALSVVLAIKKKWHEVLNLSAYKYILPATLTNGILYYLLMFFALKFTSAGNVAIVALTEVGFSFLFFHVLKKDHVPMFHIFGAILMIIGAVIILPEFPN